MSELEDIKGFTSLLKDTYSFDLHEYLNNPGWDVLHSIYDYNYMHGKKGEPKIPKKIHQIWLGSPIPDKYKAWNESWKLFHPDWEYRLWTDTDLKESEVDITDWAIFNSIQNMGQKSDYLRYHILKQFGGIYVDTDFECLRPFDSLRYADFLAGISYDAKPIVNIAILGSVPNHIIIQNCIKNLSVKVGDTSKNVFNTTGPYYFTRQFFATVESYMEGVVVLPPQFFYPFPNEVGFKERNGKDYIKDYSYAVHYWDTSWIPKRRRG